MAFLLIGACSRTSLLADLPPVASDGAGGSAPAAPDTGSTVTVGSSTFSTGGSTGGGGSSTGVGGGSAGCLWDGPAAEWNRSFGNDCAQRVSRVAADANGNVLTLGRMCGDVDLGGGVLGLSVSADHQAVFVAKYDASGAYSWSRAFGDHDATQWPATLSVGDGGDLVIAGHFANWIDLGGEVLITNGWEDAFVGRLSSTGEHLWSRAYGDVGADGARAVAAPGGEAYVGVVSEGTIDFGDGPLTAVGASDIFVAKLDAAGNPLWSKRYGDAADQGLSGIEAVPGGFLLAGEFTGELDFGDGALVAEELDVFAAKLGPDGQPLWARRFSSFGGGFIHLRLGTDPFGDVLLSGYLVNVSVDFGGGPLVAKANTVFLAKLDADGNHLWSKLIAGGDAFAHDVASDPDGNVLVAGEFIDAIDFGSGTLIAQGKVDAFVAALDADGGALWSRRAGDATLNGLFESINGVAADEAGNVVVGGEFFNSICFGLDPLTSEGDFDAFVVKLAVP